MVKDHLPTPEYLRQCLRYDDGKLFWLERPRAHFKDIAAWKRWNTLMAHTEAGTVRNHPIEGARCLVNFCGKIRFRYHFVWAIFNNEWPDEIDHKNRDSFDDRIENLRVATSQQNKANVAKRSDNVSGFKGVSWHTRGKKWQAIIKLNGRAKFLGLFIDPQEAHRAYCDAAHKAFGEFACPG